jgi:hypothetical protein
MAKRMEIFICKNVATNDEHIHLNKFMLSYTFGVGWVEGGGDTEGKHPSVVT